MTDVRLVAHLTAPRACGACGATGVVLREIRVVGGDSLALCEPCVRTVRTMAVLSGGSIDENK